MSITSINDTICKSEFKFIGFSSIKSSDIDNHCNCYWLSIFYPTLIELQTRIFKNAYAAFQACKYPSIATDYETADGQQALNITNNTQKIIKPIIDDITNIRAKIVSLQSDIKKIDKELPEILLRFRIIETSSLEYDSKNTELNTLQSKLELLYDEHESKNTELDTLKSNLELLCDQYNKHFNKYYGIDHIIDKSYKFNNNNKLQAMYKDVIKEPLT